MIQGSVPKSVVGPSGPLEAGNYPPTTAWRHPGSRGSRPPALGAKVRVG